MKERPIIFSGPMVRAVLDGRKTQTRRIIKSQPYKVEAGYAWHAPIPDDTGCTFNPISCPYGRSGDRLWVRETFKNVTSGEVKDRYGELRYGYGYKADNFVRWDEHTTVIHDLSKQPKATGNVQFEARPWKPAIHMPRRACRIMLEITDVRVELLQDISKEDARAEGVLYVPGHGEITISELRCEPGYSAYLSPRLGFQVLWESIHGKGSWDANPWVWAVTFRRVISARDT